MKGFISALITACVLITGIAPATQAKECSNRQKTDIKKGHKDWKISGLLFGQYDTENAHSSYFFAGGGMPKEPGNYLPLKVKLNVEKKLDVIKKIRTQLSHAPMAIHYGIPYLDHRGNLYDTYVPLNASPIYEYFEHTKSYGFHQKEFHEACSVKRGKKEYQKFITGYVVAVERKGFSSLTRSCNVMVNPGGTQKENRREFLYYKEKEVCHHYEGDWFPTCYTQKDPVYRYYQVDVPARSLIVAHSEEACRFAEDAGWAQVPVTIDYSVNKSSGSQNPNPTVIHRITVQKKPQTPEEEPHPPTENP